MAQTVEQQLYAAQVEIARLQEIIRKMKAAAHIASQRVKIRTRS
jgi:hypothetical protein